MLIIVCTMLLKGEDIFMTGKVVKEKTYTYVITNADGFYEFPKTDCIVKKYTAKK